MPNDSLKKNHRRWLLYAAGAGALLALVVLLAKRKGSTSPEGEVVAPANVEGETGGPGGAAGAQLGSELNAFRAELPGAVAEGNQTLAAEQAAGFTGVEQALANVESQLEKGYASPSQVRAAEEAAYHRGVSVVKEQDKAKAAAAKTATTHKTPGRPAKKSAPHHTAPKPHKKTSAHQVAKHPAVKRPAPRQPGHAAPKPHKPQQKTKRR